MAKKLTVEVDADVSKAKRKVDSLGQTGSGMGDGSSVSPAADRAARSLDRAAKGAKDLSDEAAKGSSKLQAMTKVFGGMAVRMAIGYASSQMKDGSAEQTVVKGAGDVIGGAMAGSAFGPMGALAGAVMGLTSAILDANAAEKARAEAIKSASLDYAKSELYYSKNQIFDEKLKNLTKVGGKGGISAEESLEGLGKEIEYFKRVIEENKSMIKDGLKSGDLESVSLYREFLGQNRSKLARLESASDRIKELQDNKKPDFRASMQGVDSLARLGLGGGGDYARDSLNVQKEMSATLKSIDQKTKTGGAKWQ